MEAFHRNTIKSFRKVKEDMRNLQAQMTELGRKQEELMDMISNMKTVSTSSKTSKGRTKKESY